VAGIAAADVDPQDYAAPGAAVPSKSPEDLRQEIEAEIAAERRRDEERLRREQEAARLRELELAARPLPVRLLESRCATCHEPGYFEQRRYSRLGWEVVILRMQLLNAAELAAGERAIIAAHLAAERPASAARVALDALVVSSPIALLALAVFVWRRRRKRRDAAAAYRHSG
jgi:hypothetical protein